MMDQKEKYLSNIEYTELENQIAEIRNLIDNEVKGLNEFYTFLRNIFLQLITIEMELVEINNKITNLLDKIDTTAMDAFDGDLEFDYLTKAK
jgi:hypothetical protein